MADPIRIFFDIRETSRRRNWETVRNLPKGFYPITRINSSITDFKITYHYKEQSIRNMLSKIVKFFGIPNTRTISKSDLKDAKGIYSFGAIILNNLPYVLEVDNVAGLTFYNPHVFGNPLVRKLLLRSLNADNCKQIICISEASKKSILNTFKNSGLGKKITVVYPYVSAPNPTKRIRKRIKFLYICTRFFEKGGREILYGFDKLLEKYDNIELNMVTNAPADVIETYKDSDNIHIFPAKFSKEELYQKFYSKSDVFVSLTYQDSFGLTTLEAIASGLAVITTDMFAIPEMVLDGKNGFVFKSPVNYFNEDFTPTNYLLKDMDIVARDMGLQQKLAEEFVKASINLINNPKQLDKMKAFSRDLVVNGKFSIKSRNKQLSKALLTLLS